MQTLSRHACRVPYHSGMAVVPLRPELDRRRATRDPDFRLQRVADSSGGERFVILVDGVGRFAEASKPLTESDTRKVLHKLGHSAAVIESMIDRARAAQST